MVAGVMMFRKKTEDGRRINHTCVSTTDYHNTIQQHKRHTRWSPAISTTCSRRRELLPTPHVTFLSNISNLTIHHNNKPPNKPTNKPTNKCHMLTSITTNTYLEQDILLVNPKSSTTNNRFFVFSGHGVILVIAGVVLGVCGVASPDTTFFY